MLDDGRRDELCRRVGRVGAQGCACSVWGCCALLCAWLCVGKERGREKEERRREKRKRRKRKGDAGGIRGDGREPGVASARSDAHEKRGDRESFKRSLISVSGRRFDFWCQDDESPEKIRARR